MQQFSHAIDATLIVLNLGVWVAIATRLRRGQPIVPYEPRLFVPWIGIDVIVMVVALLLVDSTVLELTGKASSLVEGEITAGVLAALTTSHLMWVGVVFIYLEQRAGATVAEIGFDTDHLAYDLRLGGVAFFAALLPVQGTELIVEYFSPSTQHQLVRLVREQPGTGLLWLVAASAVIVAPLIEELFFRVLLQGWLERQVDTMAESRTAAFAKWTRPLPVLASSTAFAVMHEGYQRIPIFVLALFLGYLYRQTHRIFPGLVLHCCTNALAVVQLALS